MLAFILIFGAAISVKSGFFQIRRGFYIYKNTIGTLFRKKTSNNKNEGLTQKGAFCSVLAATMGTGNIIGVSSAIITGGPGAVFWMWISALFGMMIVYAENYFGIICRRKDSSGKWHGGALCYIEKALKKPAALIYAFLCVFASFGMGNMVQTNSLSSAVSVQFHIPPFITGAVAAFLCGLVILGGIKRISSVTEILIPVISLIYIISALYIVIKNASLLPEVFRKIFSEAFGIKSACGGICGTLIKKAVSTGMKRGVFSNEAGLGTSSMFHSQCSEDNPELQGMWGIAEVFADTIICCTLTALSILCVTEKSPFWGSNPAELTAEAFAVCFGTYSELFICISVTLFAFATLIGWSHCGESAFRYIAGEKSAVVYRFIYCILAFAGAVLSLETVWTVSDIFNGLMIIPNILSLTVLCITKKMNTPEKISQQ